MTTDKEDECFWNILQRDTIANSKDFKLLEDNTRENKNFKNPEQKIQILKHMKILNLIIWEKQKKWHFGKNICNIYDKGLISIKYIYKSIMK